MLLNACLTTFSPKAMIGLDFAKTSVRLLMRFSSISPSPLPFGFTWFETRFLSPHETSPEPGKSLIQVLCREYGYREVHQVGSHVVLETDSPVHHRIPIPDHNPLRIGTLNAILRAVSRAKGIDKREIVALL
tara:strand:- start:143 stop:538 length:396 start_codon:yes stop_codon:yes gene_type:complete